MVTGRSRYVQLAALPHIFSFTCWLYEISLTENESACEGIISELTVSFTIFE